MVERSLLVKLEKLKKMVYVEVLSHVPLVFQISQNELNLMLSE
jgi:hypothetical protein